MKYLFIFLLTFLIGTLAMVSYGIVKKSPGKPINNIVQTIAKPDFSVADPPSDSINGTISTLSGNVDYQPRAATDSSPLTSSVTSIKQGESIQTEDNGSLSLNFRDTADIKIDPKTAISLVQTLPINFLMSEASGSATIQKIGSVPVSIRALHLLIKINNDQVEGGSEELTVGVDPDNSLVNLNIISGSITVAYNDLNLNSTEATFQSGQKITFNDLTRNF